MDGKPFFKRTIRLATFFLLLSSEAFAFRVGSWNLRYLGRSTMDFDKVSKLLFMANADLVAFQEVTHPEKSERAILEIIFRLNQHQPEETFCYAISNLPTGDTRRYAFLWKLSQIKWVSASGTIAEDCPNKELKMTAKKNQDKIVREPAVGRFYSEKEEMEFIFANVHLVPKRKYPQKEVPSVFEIFEGFQKPVIVAGDFNLSSRDPAFQAAKLAQFKESLDAKKTSLKRTKRELNQPYDNVWSRKFQVQKAKVINPFPVFPRNSPEEIYLHLSDHAPIWSDVSPVRTQ